MQLSNMLSRSSASFRNSSGKITIIHVGSSVEIVGIRETETRPGVVRVINRVHHSPIYNDPLKMGLLEGRPSSVIPGRVEAYDIFTVWCEEDQKLHSCVANPGVSTAMFLSSRPYPDDALIIQDGKDAISCAACRFVFKGEILNIASPAHFDQTTHAVLKALGVDEESHKTEFEQGFLTRRGEFVDRHEAWRIALAARQIRHWVGGCEAHGGTLYSECLL